MAEAFPYELTPDTRPTIGLIVLQADETIESDFQRLFDPKTIRLHVSRIPSGAALTPETIQQMAIDLPQAAGLFPSGVQFDTVGYACTSGTTLIGADRVAALVSESCETGAVTNPLTASITAIETLCLKRIGIVSPYIASVAEPLRLAFEEAGITVVDTLSFGEEIESNVANISADSLKAASKALAARAQVDGIFLSCTNLKTLDIIEDLESALDVPVLSSNLTLAWHLAHLARAKISGPGRLLSGLA